MEPLGNTIDSINLKAVLISLGYLTGSKISGLHDLASFLGFSCVVFLVLHSAIDVKSPLRESPAF